MYIILYSFPPLKEEYFSALVYVTTTPSVWLLWIVVLMGLSHLYDMTLHMIFYGGISAADHVTTANLKSPSFVCLTSEVRALSLASCFEVCPQQHGQCSFCCPSVILSESVVHQIIWLSC